MIEELEIKEKLILKEQCLEESQTKNNDANDETQILVNEKTNIFVESGEEYGKIYVKNEEKIIILYFENITLLKVLICACSISLFFMFIFLRGNLLLKSFAKISL